MSCALKSQLDQNSIIIISNSINGNFKSYITSEKTQG